MAATCTPGRPSVVSAFDSSSSRPAKAPDSTCSRAFLSCCCRAVGQVPGRGRGGTGGGLGLLGLGARVLDLLDRALRRLDHHRAFEFILLGVVVLDEAQLVVAHGDHDRRAAAHAS